VSGCASVGSSVEATSSATPEVTHVAVAPGDPGPIPSNSITVALGSETNAVTVCAGWVWVQVYSGTDAIVQIDPTAGAVVGQVDGGTNLACFDGEPWAAIGGNEIRHLDAETKATLASIAVVDAYYVGAAAGSIWTASGRDVLRIDPETAEVVATIPIDPTFAVTEVEGSDDAIWATVKEAEAAYRIDPVTNTVVARIQAGAYAHGILVQPGAVWISNAHEETVTRIDPLMNTALFVDGPGSGVGLAEGNGFVWASSRSDGILFRIDPASSRATPVVRIGGWPYGMAATDTALWVSDGLMSVYGIPFTELAE
jgi:glutamine cyclotransferase